MNDYKTAIFEMHSIPVGLCAAWKPKGCTFDISMHMLTGSKAGPIRQMWQELGVILCMRNRSLPTIVSRVDPDEGIG
jgi:hypothetical protein